MRTAIRSDIGASVLRYLVAVWTVGLAFAATLLMSPLVPPGISPLFLLAVMISAWRGGSGAGLLATALAALASAFVFLPPTYSLRIDRDDLLQLAVFTFAAVIIGTLSAARRRAEDEREALLVREQVARVEAERANAVKDEFLAAVSHELRTPLTTIKTLTRVMQRRDPGEAERREYLEDIASECDRQIDLVHNLLDLSRIKAGGVQIKPQRVDAAEVVRACEKIERAEAEEHGHKLIVELPPELPFVRADHSALRRALCTIAENSIKYTPDGGSITLRAYSDEVSVIIEVEDTGRGIRDEDMPHIFDKFYRGHARGDGAEGLSENEQEVPGIGLGLHLARALVEGMDGSIEVRSRAGVGSTLRLRLPVWSGESNGDDEGTALSPIETAAAKLIGGVTERGEKAHG
ncbi:MAG TPA: ATP-binding protein [Pyrinomonadaceae bacterium]|nr:ATP-binding protein [Pyrinomonadaceae bacterium]